MIQSQLEQVVEAFERAQRRAKTPDIGPFVSDVPADERADVVVELVRSDIEYRWENGLPTRELEAYRQEFPQVFADADRLREVAFEDCRQRRRHGQTVDASRYAKRFGIDVSDWQFDSLETIEETTLRGLPPDNEHVRAIYDWFSDFVPLLELGRGAAGKVYLATQGELAKRLVALKITNEPNFEPLQLAQLQHSNIVPIYSVHRHGQWQAVCMPFLGHFTLSDLAKHSANSGQKSLRGRDLLSTVAERTQETIRNQVPATGTLARAASTAVDDAFQLGELRFVPDLSYVETCVWIASRVAAGLAHAHRRGIVHSDLKPSNIVIGHDGEPLILDFHLAHRLQGAQPNFIGGTLPYMSAEHLQALEKGQAPNESSDVFSLGVILFQLLTGRLPYPERRDPLEEVLPQLIADRKSEPIRPSRIEPLVSPDIDAIVLKCLAPDANHGYSTAAELETDLKRHLDFLPPKFACSFSFRERARKWLARHPGVRSVGFIAMASAVVITAIVTWVAFRTERDARSLAASRFSNVSRELNEVAASLASAGFGGVSLIEANDRALVKLELHEIVEGAAPSWERYLSSQARDQLHEQLAEIQYLIAANHLQNLRGLTWEERERELELARKHHDAAYSHYFPRQPPSILHWQAELLRAKGAADGSPEWQRFATWLTQNSETSQTSSGWLDQRLLAIEQYRQGDFRAAITRLEAGLRNHTSDYPSWLILGNAYAKAKNFSKAEMCFLVCQTLQPTLIDSYFNRGVSRIDAGSFREAIADFDWCIELNASAPEYFANRGLCYYNLGDLKNAEADLSKAIDLGASATRLYFFRGQVRRALGNAAGADEDQAAGLKLVPSDELSWISRGFYFVESDPEQAISDFRSAIRLNPRSASAWENCAAVYADKLSQLPKAIECMDELVRIEPDNPKHWASRGALRARADLRDLALADAQAALKLSDTGETLYRVGSIFARLAEKHPKDGDQAVALIRTAASKDPLFVLRYLGKDTDLNPILERPDFVELSQRLLSLKSPPKPQ